MRWLVPALLALAACASSQPTPVGATLHDGQVLVGDITTDTLRLDSGLGTLDIPLDDVGVVLPVEGDRIADAHGHVTVWTRNGSELTGKWLEPELALGMEMGGERLHIDLPVDDLTSVQTQGSELWPGGEVYRVRTTFGDDFLVDATRTRIGITNELGTFAPFLSECATARPEGAPAGPWRLELNNGTQIEGDPVDDALTFVLPMGPETITVPLSELSSMERQHWAPSTHDGMPEESAPALSSSEGWFDYRGLKRAKR